MTVVRAHVEWKVGRGQPRDNIVNTPHFSVSGLGGLADTDWNDLAQNLLMQSRAWQTKSSVPIQLRVKLYDAEAPVPSYPKAEAELTDGQDYLFDGPRELACCLSFYHEHNRPRHRGRLYINPFLISNVGSLGEFVNSNLMDRVMEYGVVLKDLGGINVDWVVWSRRDKKAYPVTDYWVDNEWDAQRRRGLRSITRKTATTDEALAARAARVQAWHDANPAA